LQVSPIKYTSTARIMISGSGRCNFRPRALHRALHHLSSGSSIYHRGSVQTRRPRPISGCPRPILSYGLEAAWSFTLLFICRIGHHSV